GVHEQHAIAVARELLHQVLVRVRIVIPPILPGEADDGFAAQGLSVVLCYKSLCKNRHGHELSLPVRSDRSIRVSGYQTAIRSTMGACSLFVPTGRHLKPSPGARTALLCGI